MKDLDKLLNIVIIATIIIDFLVSVFLIGLFAYFAYHSKIDLGYLAGSGILLVFGIVMSIYFIKINTK